MEVIAVISRKGGVGKTATAQALGAGLLRRKKKVLFIDLDSQCNLTYTTNADTNRPNSMQLLAGEKHKDYIQELDGDVIAGSESLAAADTFLTDTGKEYRLREAIEPYKKKYDYIIIDTPAALGIVTINALTAADAAIIPVQADVYSLQGIGQLNDTIEAVKRYCNPSLYIRGILCTRYNGRAVISRDMMDNLADTAKALNTKLYKTPIRECIAVKEAQASQRDIFTYAPKSNAAKDYEEFIKDFMKGGRKNGK